MKARAFMFYTFAFCSSVTVTGVLVTGCTARETAKDAYTAQSEACVSIYSGDASAQRSCLDYVRAKWTEAGAPAAAQLDGGAE